MSQVLLGQGDRPAERGKRSSGSGGAKLSFNMLGGPGRSLATLDTGIMWP